jgi:uncharacterized SAM-binding protein YcdF (DUF218 family)
MSSIDTHVRDLARKLWDYHVLQQPLDRADFVLALGSHDERVAMHAAALVRMGLADNLVAAGGAGKVTGRLWTKPEAERYAEIATEMGVPSERVLTETESTNTGENVTYTRKLLASQGWPANRGILVSKPYMARRSLYTARAQWPEARWQVAPPPLSFESYASDDVPEERMINLLVGDLQRMWVYADRGLQVPAEIPEDVRQAYDELVSRGFDQFVLEE